MVWFRHLGLNAVYVIIQQRHQTWFNSRLEMVWIGRNIFFASQFCVALTPRILALLVLGANSKGGYSGGYSGGGLAAAATRLWQGLGSMVPLPGSTCFGECVSNCFCCFCCFLRNVLYWQNFFVFFHFLNQLCQNCVAQAALGVQVWPTCLLVWIVFYHETFKTSKDSLGNNHWQPTKRL